MKEYDLDFCFKGNRTYVHGTDIYNKMIEILKNHMKKEKFDLSFHGIAKSNISISEQMPEDESLLKFACKYFDKNNDRKIYYGIENNKEIECRYEYPEEDICKLAKLDFEKQEVILDAISSFSFVENTVALNKYLLEELFPDLDGKWYFTRFQIQEVPADDIYPLKLSLKANFNFKLTKTEIFINDISVGNVYFSLV